MKQVEGASDLDVRAAYKVGRDCDGRWMAMEATGRGGGMFASREAALRFAEAETYRRVGAVCEFDRPLSFG